MDKTILFLVMAFIFHCAPSRAQMNNMLASTGSKSASHSANNMVNAPSVGLDTEEWEFLSGISPEFSVEEIVHASHPFGGKIACMLQLVKSLYVTKEEVVPGDPQTRTMLKKPDIYNAVGNVEKYLKKQFKDKQLTQEQVQQQFTQVLQVALAAIDTEATISFEDALRKNRKDANAQLSVFYKVKVKSIY